ncbi:hypothetical protein EOM39_07360, partial [Candidatus Gracilibacteria bacterium]|nr:hypothetical protein [Candidatus Gracilibacteria bacterium]
MGNRTALENYRLKEKQTQVCTEETVVEEFVNANGKTKTRERKVRNCTPEVTVVEKQLNTLDFTANELNQYTLLENKNKNGELKKEFKYKYDLNGNLQEDDINMYFYDYKNRLVKVVKK